MNPFFNRFYDYTARSLRAAKGKSGLNAVCSQAHKELDKVFAAELAQSGQQLACCSGCSYCCHIKVDAQPREIFLIADFIRARFSAEKQIDILKRAKENWSKIEPMTLDQHFKAGLPCPLLENEKCSVYQVRPSGCRNAHSLRAEPCKAYLENPESTEIFAEQLLDLKVATVRANLGASAAFEAGGYDSQPYDLNAALIETFENPSCERRWRDKKSAFPKNMVAKDWPEGMRIRNLSAG